VSTARAAAAAIATPPRGDVHLGQLRVASKRRESNGVSGPVQQVAERQRLAGALGHQVLGVGHRLQPRVSTASKSLTVVAPARGLGDDGLITRMPFLAGGQLAQDQAAPLLAPCGR